MKDWDNEIVKKESECKVNIEVYGYIGGWIKYKWLRIKYYDWMI